MKKIILPLLLVIFTYSSTFSTDKAKGFFISFGVGPRFPMGSFASTTVLGYGLNVEFSYTDNEIIPFFIFAKVGYEQYPGSQKYYESTDYSNFSTTTVPINLGIRHYFSPLLESAFLLIPILEASASFSYIKELHEFKLTSGKNNYYDEKYNFGFSAGLGVSMFLMEILASYNYIENNQFISADLKLRLPLLVIF